MGHGKTGEKEGGGSVPPRLFDAIRSIFVKLNVMPRIVRCVFQESFHFPYSYLRHCYVIEKRPTVSSFRIFIRIYTPRFKLHRKYINHVVFNLTNLMNFFLARFL